MTGRYDAIFIKDFTVDCSIGVYAEEHQKPQRVIVNAAIQILPREKNTADELDTTLDYHDLLKKLKALMESRHRKLLETLAEEMAELALQHPAALAINLRLEKPDIIPGAVVGVEIYREAKA